MSGIIVPSGSSAQPALAGGAKSPGTKKTKIDPSKRIVSAYAQAAPAMHAPRGSLVTTLEGAVPSPGQMAKPITHARRGRAVMAIAAVAAIGFVVMAAQLALTAAYGGRFLPGISIAGQQLGGLTRPQAQHLLTSSVAAARVRFVAAGTSYNVAPSTVGASFDVQSTLDRAYAVGHQPNTFMPVAIWQSMQRRDQLGMSYNFHQPTLQALVQKVVDGSGQKPIDATIVITNGVPAVQPAVSGHDLAAPTVTAAIASQLAEPNKSPPVLHPSTQAARIQASDLPSALDQTKQLLATSVTITYQNKSFQPTSAQIGNWVIYDKSPLDKAPALTPKLSPDAIGAYLATIAKQINVSPVTQKISVQNGVSNVFQQGQNGVALDTVALAAKLTAITPGQPFTVVAPTSPVPFQTQYNNSIPLPYDQYIEVNLSLQHLWVYQNHTVIFDSPVTSGATGAGFPTATGLFSILAKQTNRHLVGYQYGPAYNYDVYVQYWMPFYQGFGLHDASWRSSFGGQDYYYGGSHGCVNLPLATAAYLFNWASIGTPVWVHT